MSDLISRQAAIDALENVSCSDGNGISVLKCEAIDDVVRTIRNLPSVQSETHEKRTKTHACDCISRQSAIEAYGDWYVEEGTEEGFIGTVKQLLEGLPSAQPDACENTREIERKSNDMISRQAAIDAIGEKSDEIYKTKQKGATYPHDDFFQGMAYAENIVKQLPSAQPERKRGKWIKGANHGLGVYTLTCDKCGYVDVSSNVINYCPNCGAKMEGE